MSWADTSAALLRAQVLYWLTVAPHVRTELRQWQGHAQRIRDPVLRAHAAQKLRDERGNTEAIATLCTLAPRPHRQAVIEAAVALQVMYDYLDAVSEQPVDDPIRDGRQLFRSFSVALTPGERPTDYYRYHPQSDDSGYLDALVERCRRSLEALPSLGPVLPTAREVAERFSEAQILSHAVPHVGVDHLERWALPRSQAAGLMWWEWAGGAAASILGVHALVSAAATLRTTSSQAADIDRAYLLSSTLTTMLDSLVDEDRDSEEGGHRYISYYADTQVAGRRVVDIALRAKAAARSLPHGAHHAMTVAGIAAFYLSAASSTTRNAAPVRRCVIAELKPLITPILAVFRLWRWLRD